jgi:hypothetical protein
VATVGTEPGRTHIFRVCEYTFSQTDIWYRDGWSMKTGCQGGGAEKRLRAATKAELESWEYKYDLGLYEESKKSKLKQA